MTPEIVNTIGMKDVDEAADFPKPVKITDLPRGTFIDTLTVSPDGSLVLFTTLTGKTTADLRSTMLAVHSDGSGGVISFGDGKSLDLHPCFTPDGSQIVFVFQSWWETNERLGNVRLRRSRHDPAHKL